MIDFKNYERVSNKNGIMCPYTDYCEYDCKDCSEYKRAKRLTELENLIEQGKLVEKIKPKTAKERIEFELAELVERKNKLFNFLLTDKYNMLDIKSKDFLNQQIGVMQDYIDILQERLNIWEDIDERL